MNLHLNDRNVYHGMSRLIENVQVAYQLDNQIFIYN